MSRCKKEEMRSKAITKDKTLVTPARSNQYNWPKDSYSGPNYKQPDKGVSSKGSLK